MIWLIWIHNLTCIASIAPISILNLGALLLSTCFSIRLQWSLLRISFAVFSQSHISSMSWMLVGLDVILFTLRGSNGKWLNISIVNTYIHLGYDHFSCYISWNQFYNIVTMISMTWSQHICILWKSILKLCSVWNRCSSS